MESAALNTITADVKCYYCGHIGGQIIGRRGEPLTVTNFIPRPGYTGPEVKPGTRLRCERCQGPVFLEDTSISMPRPGPSGKLNAQPKVADTRVRKAA